MPQSSAAASGWQFQHIADTNATQVGKSAFVRSNIVLVSEPYLLPHARQSHLCDPFGPARPSRGARRRRRGGMGAAA
ncbi:hypothetical protein HMPREF1316_2671 [Olsenella profusa F0195]|uniref:Uncharacterized protein n=2 Tax=Olsenella profusa TaxID=138595 RepID=U2T378_9ACTN|nr:hypothetical protein HMPREF1316_2671 [Olsenella profusa F0195]